MLGAILAGVFGLVATVCADVIVYTRETPHTLQAEIRDLPASFGGDLPPEGLRGLLVYGDPPNGCGNLTKPPPDNNFTGKWIVLIARYNCSFEEKVRNAQAAGYDCVIVHNVNSSELETMSANNPEDILIPSVFIRDIDGEILKKQYLYDQGYYVMVNGDMPFNINTHLLLPFAVVVVLCLVVILISMVVKCVRDRRRARRHRLPNRSLKKIPTCKFSKVVPYETCAICLDDYQEGERLRVLPCAHAYHAKCVDPWLTQNRRVCPVCKRRVFAAGERPTRRDDSDSSDTEPLVNEVPHTDTQGGTFEEQRENPFVRAARLMSRFRRARNEPQQSPPSSPSIEDNDQTNNENEENTQGGGESESAPLLPASVRAERERPRRQRRRRARSAAARAERAEHAEHADSTPPAPTHLLHSDSHSINTDNRGEIGVAALPAPLASSTPHHIDL